MDALSSSVSTNTQPGHIVRSWWAEDRAQSSHVPGTEGLGFGDFIDLINPLHHIPILGTIYRELTGDEIKPSVQVAGGLLYGAVTGSVLLSGVASVASAIYEQKTGSEPTVQIAHSLFGSETIQDTPKENGTVQIAQAEHIGSAPKETVGEASSETIDLEIPQKREKVAQRTVQKETTKSAAVDGQTLGLMLQEQAQTHQAGQALPPELVHDMMLMAFEKYQAAQAITGEKTTIQ